MAIILIAIAALIVGMAIAWLCIMRTIVRAGRRR